MFRSYRSLLLIAGLFMFTMHLFSCISPKKVVYLYDLKDTTSASSLHTAQINFETPIQKNDQLWITVGGSNIADLAIINSASGLLIGTSSAQTSGGSSTGYLVEADGRIKIPFLGFVQAEGLSRLQLEAFLTEKLKDYTKDPVVNVRFLNYNFSVIGEVARPGRFNMPTERTTILEALSLAGDIGVLGRRENILVIREVNGQRELARLNLLSKDIFNSPFYYLKTNDVIYVEPVKSRFITRSGATQYFGIAAIAISLLITIINLSK